MVDREALGRGFLLERCPLDCSVCGLSMHDRKLIMTNDEGRKSRYLAPIARTNAQYSNRDDPCVSCVIVIVMYVINKLVLFFFY